MKTFFYQFAQNNSGGGFETDDKVCHRLFIEAENAKNANKKAKELGVYFNGCNKGLDCSCCGDRWGKVDESDTIDLEQVSNSYKQVFETINDYAQYLANKYGWTNPDARIFYINGNVVDIVKEQ